MKPHPVVTDAISSAANPLDGALLVQFDHARAILGGPSRPTIYRMIDRGELEVVKVGRRSMIKASSIRRLLGEAA